MSRGHRFHLVFAEVESRDGKRYLRLPSACLRTCILVRFNLLSSGHESQALWPVKRKVKGNEMFIANVGIPRPAFAHELDSIPSVSYHVAVIGDLQTEFIPRIRWSRKDDEDRIVAAAQDFPAAHFFILEIDERPAIGPFD